VKDHVAGAGINGKRRAAKFERCEQRLRRGYPVADACNDRR
jgi:hypothetical protein